MLGSFQPMDNCTGKQLMLCVKADTRKQAGRPSLSVLAFFVWFLFCFVFSGFVFSVIDVNSSVVFWFVVLSFDH